jgi:hypothetical protein
LKNRSVFKNKNSFFDSQLILQETEVFPKSSYSDFFPKCSPIALKLIARLSES